MYGYSYPRFRQPNFFAGALQAHYGGVLIKMVSGSRRNILTTIVLKEGVCAGEGVREVVRAGDQGHLPQSPGTLDANQVASRENKQHFIYIP